MFVLGYEVGRVIGALAALKSRVYRVRPQVWQRALGLRRPKAMDKTGWKNNRFDSGGSTTSGNISPDFKGWYRIRNH
jgi:hypothetical protein